MEVQNPLLPFLNAIEKIELIDNKLDTLLLQKENDNTLLTPKEAAHEAGVHINTIRNLMKSGQLEITYVGSIKRIARKELHKVKSRK